MTISFDSLRKVAEQLKSDGGVCAPTTVFRDASALKLVQFRFPRSRKSRIRNKWRWEPSNYRTEPTGYRIGDALVLHPDLYDRLFSK